MQLSALEEYGVRCALQLARTYSEGPLSASKVAEKEGLSVEYVSKIMHLFKKSGLVAAARGNQGGFYLTEAPSDIPLKRLLDGIRPQSARESTSEFCNHYTGQGQSCVHIGECALRPVWGLLGSYFDEVLKNLTLQDLLGREVDSEKVVRTLAAEKAKFVTDRIRGAGADASARTESAEDGGR